MSNDIDNSNTGGDINIGDVGSPKNSGSTPSPGAIAGITVACTVVMAVAAVVGVWYARKDAKNKPKT